MQAFNRGAQDNSNHIYVIYNINNYTRFLVECQVWPGALPTKKPLQECLRAIKPKILRGTLHCLLQFQNCKCVMNWTICNSCICNNCFAALKSYTTT